MATSPKIPGSEKRICDPVNIIVQNILKIVFYGSLLFLILSPLAYLKQSPYYEAKGQIRISPVIPAFLGPMEDLSITGYYHDHLRTELEMLQDPALLETVVANSNHEFLSSLEIPDDKVQLNRWYENHVNIKQVPRTQLLELVAINHNSNNLSRLVNALLAEYLRKNKVEEEEKDKSRIEYLNQVKEELNASRVLLQNKLEKLAIEMRTGTFQQGYWVHREWLAETQKSLARARAALITSESELVRVDYESSALKEMDITGIIENRLSQDDSLWNTEFWTYRQIQNMRSTIDGITEKNPDRIYIDERMRNAQEYLESTKNKSKERAVRIENLLRDIKAKQKNIHAKSKVNQDKKITLALEEESKRLEDAAGKSAQKMIIARSWQKELEHISKMEFRLNERIHELKLDTKAPDRVTLEKYAIHNENIAGTNLKKLLVMSALLSFGLFIVYYYIKELRDDRIRSPQHIEMACGKPPSWPISAATDETPFLDNVLKGKSDASARALRSLGFKLIRSHKTKRALKICLSGTQSAVGVTSIGINVAQAVSNGLKKTVYIANNTDSSTIKKVVLKAKKLPYKLPKGYRGTHDAIRGFDFIWCTSKNNNKLHLLLKNLQNNHDHIFIDCDPLLTSEKTEAAAGLSDINLLVCKGDHTRFTQFRRCFEILWRLETKHFIPILNWGA